MPKKKESISNNKLEDRIFSEFEKIAFAPVNSDDLVKIPEKIKALDYLVKYCGIEKDKKSDVTTDKPDLSSFTPDELRRLSGID